MKKHSKPAPRTPAPLSAAQLAAATGGDGIWDLTGTDPRPNDHHWTLTGPRTNDFTWG